LGLYSKKGFSGKGVWVVLRNGKERIFYLTEKGRDFHDYDERREGRCFSRGGKGGQRGASIGKKGRVLRGGKKRGNTEAE